MCSLQTFWLQYNYIIFRQLFVTVDAKDDNYMPHHIVVMGGDSDSLKEISEVFIDA